MRGQRCLGDALRRRGIGIWLTVSAVALTVPAARADELILKDGMVLEGNFVRMPTIVDHPPRPGDQDKPIPRPILLVSDELRRIFIHRNQVADIRGSAAFSALERFRIPHRGGRGNRVVQSAGPPLRIEPFDEYGRRTYSMYVEPQGRVDVIQAITEIDSRVARVSAVNFLWETRVATASIPPETIERMLRRVVEPDNADHRLRLARFFIEGRYYREAREELNRILQEFPDKAPKAEIEEALNRLTQTQAREVLAEVHSRRRAGQHLFAAQLLERFPQDGVSALILQEVQGLLQEYNAQIEEGRRASEQLTQWLAELPETERAACEPAVQEIVDNLTIDLMTRLKPALSLADDADLDVSQKLALAITGYLMGGDGAQPDVALANRLWRARDLVMQYLREPQHVARQRILEELRNVEGVSPERIARILPQLTPPIAQAGVEPGKPTPVHVEEGKQVLDYLVLLPPEYRTDRRYPVVVTLHGGATTPEQQIVWWATQAGRHGYIVLAPEFAQRGQAQYGFTAEEHAAVVGTLRDAMKRWQLDSDRVFLSGHSMGAQAAWDIGLSHPHLFAGVIPIAGHPDKYSLFYRENAANLPFYVLGGEKDGSLPYLCAKELDHWLGKGYDARYVEYIGRGHEHFREEIHHLFDWMNRRSRVAEPKEFACRTLRASDDRFYWLEIANRPEAMVLPVTLWGKKKRNALSLKTSISGKGQVTIVGGGNCQLNVWLRPDLIDFEQRQQIAVNGKDRFAGFVEPNLETMLEDARVRGDRQRFYWAKVAL